MMRSPAETARPLLALGSLAALLVIAASLAVASRVETPEAQTARRANRLLVLELGLTDLALWSEAAYCRHPSQADRFAAWSDHPAALEHFPAGSLVPPPPLPDTLPDGWMTP